MIREALRCIVVLWPVILFLLLIFAVCVYATYADAKERRY